MAEVGRVRFGFTDRYGIAGSPPETAAPELLAAGRPSADSRYGSFNLGDHVGDDPGLVADRRRSLAAKPVVFMAQVHGKQVTAVPSHPGRPVSGTDALVTSARSLPLAVLVADCLPVLIYEPQVEVIGCAHAGRRGIELGILPATVDAIERCGGSRSAMFVTIGPSIGPCCYEVPAAMRDAVCELVPEARATTRWGTPSLDLRSAAVSQLRAVGVTEVTVSDVCTFESEAHYSYRRDGVTGRFAGVIELTEDGADTA